MATVNEERKKALLRCNKCGFCLAHCPVYKVTGVEWTTARGRISLIRNAMLDNKLDFRELDGPVYNCLTCNACVDDCPAGVQTAEIIFDAREALRSQYGDSWMSRLVFRSLLSIPSRLYKASRLLRLSDVVGLRVTARKLGLTRLMGDAGKAEVMMPRVPKGKGLVTMARLAEKIEHPKYRVAYFVGCYAANFAPEEATSTIRIFHKNRVEVVVPEFVCCGIPASGYGDVGSAQNMAIKNIRIASKQTVDAIVTPCASCSSFLKEYAKLLAGLPEWIEASRIFSSKVKDLSEFLIDIGLVTEMGTLRKKVTFHDPCHLVRYQKIKQQPRELIKSIPGLEFVEMKESDMCCGAAGTYIFKNFDLSMKVLARKMDNVEKTGAEVLVSSCPACIMQLSHGVKTQKIHIQTSSVVQLLDRAYQTARDTH